MRTRPLQLAIAAAAARQARSSQIPAGVPLYLPAFDGRGEAALGLAPTADDDRTDFVCITIGDDDADDDFY